MEHNSPPRLDSHVSDSSSNGNSDFDSKTSIYSSPQQVNQCTSKANAKLAEALDLSQYDPSCERELARKDFRDSETRLGCMECLVWHKSEVEPTIIGLGVYCRLGLMSLPPELQCNIAQRLENEDILNLRLTFSKGIANGIDYAFCKRFFSVCRVKTTERSLQHFNRILGTRLCRAIQTIEIEPTVEYWSKDQSAGDRLGRKWAPVGRLNYVDDALHQTSSFQKSMANPLHRLFTQMKNLRHVVVKPPRLVLLPDADPAFHYSGAVRQEQRWESIQASQYSFISSLFRAIADAKLELETFGFRGFCDEVWHQIFAPSPNLLASIRWNKPGFAMIKTLFLEYDVHMTEATPYFLSILAFTPKLKYLRLSLAGKIEEHEAEIVRNQSRIDFITESTRLVLGKLALEPKFFLTHLGLKGMLANGEVTLDRVFRAHKETLCKVMIEDIWFHRPNNLRKFFEALAEADLDYIGLRSFLLPDQQYLTMSSFKWLPTEPDMELDWMEEENEEADVWDHEIGTDDEFEANLEGVDQTRVRGQVGNTGLSSRTPPKDVTYKGWEYFTWDNYGIEAWVEFGGGKPKGHVKKAMRDCVTLVDCGALPA
ncbi:hypothetical protein K505DRAFT_396456 [Melanomma pulvis-pyrius CBS 109.77]|uniref:Uncharacterized protein n=1 Tax=Melanomma pulvis-pyrius CBS 109.77 TaxID=1314802 RepID=A0A6A6WUG7_9PLEO|nr:hypothetical protein K505DRAFT_396456 [Melanomma pulvis-pyrius CBS 109.77]